MKHQTFNLHTHTARCGHAQGLDSQYVECAITAGFKLLGFSDHIPFKEIIDPQSRMCFEQKDEYRSSILALKEQYKGSIDIALGYEVEYIEDQLPYLLAMKEECDYMILGQHLKYLIYEYDSGCSDEDVEIYVRQIEQALEKNFITYVAHPDYFMLGRRLFSEVCVEAAHRIAQASITYDVPLEINLNGFQYGKKDYQFYHELCPYEKRYPYPMREFWRIVSAYGCKVLYGYDAHSPLTLLEKQRVAKAEEILSGIPLNFIESIELK